MNDATRSRVAPRSSLGPLEGRLYIVALLAGGYLFAWRAIDATTSMSTPTVTAPIDKVAVPQSPFVWFDDLPRAQRPVLSIPPGWQLTSRGGPGLTVPSSHVTRIPASRPLRVRTRSS
ncbi:MAG TPA: hypothetical protein VFQ65_28720 [Kofleriaceae bacterium]|nr:hypothetical protein [Kofleriaceae bacterium]